jgi:hypothetical protein
MKRVFLILFVLVFASTQFINAQDSLKRNPLPAYKYNIGLFFQPTLDVGFNLIYWFNYTAGLRTNIKISNRLSLNAGLGYGNEKYDLEDKIPVNCNELPPKSYEAKTIKTSLRFRCNIFGMKKAFKFYGIYGNDFNFHLYEKYQYYQGEEGVLRKLKFYNTIFNTGFGFERSIRQFSINLEPTMDVPIRILSNWGRSDYLGKSPWVLFPYFCRLGADFGVVYRWN